MDDEMYLEDTLDRLKYKMFVIAGVCFSLVVSIGIIAWLISGDSAIIYRTFTFLLIGWVVGIKCYYMLDTEPSLSGDSQSDSDVWTEDEL